MVFSDFMISSDDERDNHKRHDEHAAHLGPEAAKGSLFRPAARQAANGPGPGRAPATAPGPETPWRGCVGLGQAASSRPGKAARGLVPRKESR